MKAKSFDKKFDSGADVSAQLDLSKAKRTQQDQRRVNVQWSIRIRRYSLSR
jgi:hypothetical protein